MTRHPDDEALRDAIQEGRERLAEKGPMVVLSPLPAVEFVLQGTPAIGLVVDFRDYPSEPLEGWSQRWAPTQPALPGATFIRPDWMEKK